MFGREGAIIALSLTFASAGDRYKHVKQKPGASLHEIDFQNGCQQRQKLYEGILQQDIDSNNQPNENSFCSIFVIDEVLESSTAARALSFCSVGQL